MILTFGGINTELSVAKKCSQQLGLTSLVLLFPLLLLILRAMDKYRIIW